MNPVVSPGLLDALADGGDVVTDPAVLASYRRDQAAPGIVPAGTPAALVRPRTTAEVSAVLRAASRHGAVVVPRGAGSGLSGGANAIDGCVVLGLERMTTVREVDAEAMTATVEAGVVNAALGAAARDHGLWYPPDPASFEFSTIGGNVATNAGGLCCVKYGVTRDALLEVEVVLADGDVVRIGHRTRKAVAGYDLLSLMCGSEGTLGVITEVTVRLQPPMPRGSTLAASFAVAAQAGEAVQRLARLTRPSMLELMDAATLAAVEEMAPMDLDPSEAVMLFARADGGVETGGQIAAMERICTEAGATLVVTSDDEAEGRMITAARRLAYPALERRGATLLDDVAVPLPRIPAFLAGVERIAAEEGLLIGTFGHAGDGNMHPTIVYDQRDDDSVARAKRAFASILRLGLELGGTITGEHGVGALKRDFLSADLGAALPLHRRVKDALDPGGVLNPGRAI